MKFLMVVIAIISFLILTPTHGEEQQRKAVRNQHKIFGAEYFPINKENVLVYNSNLGRTVLQIDSLPEFFRLSYTAPNLTYSQFIKITDESVLLKKVENKIFFWENSYDYSTLIPRLLLPFSVGKKWNWEGIEIHAGDSIYTRIEVDVMGEEFIVTEAGEYKCVKIFTKITSADGTLKTSTEWFAENIGIVKAVIKMKGTGIPGLILKLFGLDEISFELSEIKSK